MTPEDHRTVSTRQLKQRAMCLGFDAIGIAEALPLTDPISKYKEWIAAGSHGLMQYLERNLDKREDVSLILPGAKSVIVVARNYYTDHDHSEGAVGKISRYAWGDDYHDVLKPLLHQLSAEIDEIVPGSTSRVYVDTGPVMEKEWAVRAGLGWQGKHSNILRRDIGSWFFLGIVITTADFVADRPMDDFCGSCTACIDACPTQAITAPYQVEATKCLSYWTIEVRPEHAVPSSIQEHLDGWLYGCDVCQDVCPWNRFQTPTTEPRFEPRDGVTDMPPQHVVNLTLEEFNQRFRRSPMKRPKLAGLQRTAHALLGGGSNGKEEKEG
jgi:epoxyqueuosine reductase